MDDARFFKTPDELRAWLAENHATESELWVGIYKKGVSKPGVTLREAQDVGMCFGWVDSMSRRIDEEAYKLRFTPRRPKSSWTEDNVRRAEALREQGLMHESGIRALEERKA